MMLPSFSSKFTESVSTPPLDQGHHYITSTNLSNQSLNSGDKPQGSQMLRTTA